MDVPAPPTDSLLHLPDELLVHISLFLLSSGKRHLRNLMLSSRRLHSLGLPHLVRSVDARGRGPVTHAHFLAFFRSRNRPSDFVRHLRLGPGEVSARKAGKLAVLASTACPGLVSLRAELVSPERHSEIWDRIERMATLKHLDVEVSYPEAPKLLDRGVFAGRSLPPGLETLRVAGEVDGVPLAHYETLVAMVDACASLREWSVVAADGLVGGLGKFPRAARKLAEFAMGAPHARFGLQGREEKLDETFAAAGFDPKRVRLRAKWKSAYGRPGLEELSLANPRGAELVQGFPPGLKVLKLVLDKPLPAEDHDGVREALERCRGLRVIVGSWAPYSMDRSHGEFWASVKNTEIEH
ncbi:hypothetical protein DFJ74DRAFT_702394 [Hyaloraphidium curvatum]|nr:hypothetical protein DFJ74DRAFT_702394 [Hyaloraphidium curvatum]